jgi:hypothetical protein
MPLVSEAAILSFPSEPSLWLEFRPQLVVPDPQTSHGLELVSLSYCFLESQPLIHSPPAASRDQIPWADDSTSAIHPMWAERLLEGSVQVAGAP